MQPTDPNNAVAIAGQAPAFVLVSTDVSAASLSAAYLNSILPAISSAYQY